MSGGGKGGSTTSTVNIPEWLQTAAQGNLAKANEISQIGYTPYYGPDVAAMMPTQIAAGQNINSAAGAFGLAGADPTAGMPMASTFDGGITGYSSAPLYQQALAQLQGNAPGQYAALRAPFINPQTGAAPVSPYGSIAPAPTPSAPQGFILGSGGSNSSDSDRGWQGMAMSSMGGSTGNAYQDQMDRLNSWADAGATPSYGYGNTAGQAISSAGNSMGSGK